MGATAVWQLPYPEGVEPADVPTDMRELCERLETVLSQIQGAAEGKGQPGDLKWVSYPVAAGAEEPGWLLCDGRAVSRTDFAALFAKIGTGHGAGDGSTTFNLPDATNRTLVGVGGPRTLGEKGGAETRALTTAEMPAHSHGGVVSTNGQHSHGVYDPGHGHSASCDAQGNHTHPTHHAGLNFGEAMGAANAASGTTRAAAANWYPNTGAGGQHQHNIGIGGSGTGIGINGDGNHNHGINAEGGGAAFSLLQPFFTGHCLIKT